MLFRSMAGFHLTNRADVAIEGAEAAIKIKIADPPKLRTLGDLIHFDNVSFKFPGAKQPLLEEVTFTVEQGGRCAFVGAVRLSPSPPRPLADDSRRTVKVNRRSPSSSSAPSLRQKARSLHIPSSPSATSPSTPSRSSPSSLLRPSPPLELHRQRCRTS